MALTKISGDILQTPLSVGIVTATRIDGDINGNVNSTGVSTFTTLKVGTSVNISSGVVTASAFVGDGSGLTNVSGGGGGGGQWVTTSVGIHTLSNVGVGTTNPTSKLTVSGNVLVSGVVTASAFVGDGSGLTNVSGGGGGGQWVTTSAGIHTLSNVGVGTTNPTSTLTVKGNTSLETLNVSGVSTFNSGTYFKSSTYYDQNPVRAYFGNFNELSIFSTGTYSGYSSNYIDADSGYIDIRNLRTTIRNPQNITQRDLAIFDSTTFNAEFVKLYYGGNEKFATIGTGVTVTGTTFTNQLSVSGVVTATSFSGSGASLTSLNASNLSSGTVPTAQLASGTANSTTYLRGDQTWASISGGATLTNDTTTNATYYPTFSSTTSGTYSTAYVSNTKCTFNPSTGTLSATVFTSLSDQTQKTNIRPVKNAINLVTQMNGVYYDWINSNNTGSVGVIAQEIEKVLPEVVSTNEQGLKSVSYGNIVGVLIEAIKEQQNRIEELERKLNQ